MGGRAQPGKAIRSAHLWDGAAGIDSQGEHPSFLPAEPAFEGDDVRIFRVQAERFGIVVAFGFGILVRAAPIVGAESVVGDGGLWLAMIDDFGQQACPSPPRRRTTVSTSRSSTRRPPSSSRPLGNRSRFPRSSFSVASTVLSILGLAAFAWLAVRTLNPAAAAAATLAYGLMPSAYGWLVAVAG